MIQVIDKFLEEKELEKIDFLFSETNLPWFFNASSIYAHGDPNAQDDKKFMFTHMFMFEGKVNSDFYPVIEPIINKLSQFGFYYQFLTGSNITGRGGNMLFYK